MSRLGQLGIIQFVPLLLLLVGLVAGVYLVQKQGFQIFKPQAYDVNPQPRGQMNT